MPKAPNKRSVRAGRPPAGTSPDGQPEKTSEYPKLTVSIRPVTKAKLDALVALQKRPAWRIIEDAISLSIHSLSSEDRALVEAIAQRNRLEPVELGTTDQIALFSSRKGQEDS